MSDAEPPKVRRRWIRFFRFRLSTLFILMTVVSLLLGFVGVYWYRHVMENWAIKDLREAGATVVLNKEGVATRVWFGPKSLDDERLADLEADLLRLTALGELDFVETPITDAGLKHLRLLKRIRVIYLHQTQATDAGFKELAAALPGVELKRERPDPVASKLVSRTIFRSAVVAVASSPDGKWLASGSGDGTLRWWQNDETTATETIQAHENWLFTLAFNPDGKMLASGGGDNQIKLWDVATRKLVFELPGHTNDVHSLVFDPAGKWLYSAGDDRVIRVWDLSARKQVDVLEGHEGSIPNIALSPDGHTLASGSRDDTIRLWDVASSDRKQVRQLEGHHADVGSVAFSPDGASVASAGYDNKVRVWNVADGTEKAVLAGHTDWVFAVRFFPDGERIASGAGDNTIRIWDIKTQSCVATYTGQSNVSSIRFDSTGHSLISTAADGTIFVRDAAFGTVQRVLGTRFGDRDLAMVPR